MGKVRVNHQFEKDDGGIGTRSTMEDGMSLPRRLFIRISKHLHGDEGDKILIPGVNAYNCGDYEDAIQWFHKVVALHPELAAELEPHIDACNLCYRNS